MAIYAINTFVLQSRRTKSRMALANLREEGVKVRNASLNLQLRDGSFDEWLASTVEWESRVVAAIARIDEPDAEGFKILNAGPPPEIPLIHARDHHEGAHFKAHREHDFRIKKLEDLIERYGSR